MVDRPTPLESDQARCHPILLEDSQNELESLKRHLDTFMIYRNGFDRAQMIYLAGEIMHRVANFFSPFLCDIGMTMHHESLSDEDYTELLKELQAAQTQTQNQAQNQTQGEADGNADGNAGQTQNDPQ